MSRGGLLLRKAGEGVELEYVPVAGAVLHGAPASRRLPARQWLDRAADAFRVDDRDNVVADRSTARRSASPTCARCSGPSSA